MNPTDLLDLSKPEVSRSNRKKSKIYKKTNSFTVREDMVLEEILQKISTNPSSIVLVKNKQTIGLGHGQTNRVDALKDGVSSESQLYTHLS